MKLDILKITITGRTALCVASNSQNKGRVNERREAGVSFQAVVDPGRLCLTSVTRLKPPYSRI